MNCIFCKIIKGEIPGKFVSRDENIVVFHDISPKAPVHVLVVPVKHIENLMTVTDADSALLGKMMKNIQDVANTLGIGESGYKVVMNNGADSGQLVYHLHAHVLGGWKKKVHWDV